MCEMLRHSIYSQRKGRKAILSSKCMSTGPSYCNNQAEGNLFGYQKDQASNSHHSCKVGVATPMFFMSNILAGSENLGELVMAIIRQSIFKYNQNLKKHYNRLNRLHIWYIF